MARGEGGLGCGATLAKWLLIIINILVLLAGAAVLGIGIWLLVDDGASKYFEIISVDTTETLVRTAIIIFIVIGGIAFVVGFCGCCGACKECSTLLLIYVVIVVLILLLQIAAGILAAVYKTEVEDKLKSSMEKTVGERYGTEEYDSLTSAWDFMQVEFECCGANGYTDWNNSTYRSMNDSTTYPLTCCKLANKDYQNPIAENETQCLAGNSNSIYQEGCYDAFKKWVDDRVVVLIAVAFALLAIQVLAIIMACCLRKTISNQNAYA
jgi:uncharacterized membrane protein